MTNCSPNQLPESAVEAQANALAAIEAAQSAVNGIDGGWDNVQEIQASVEMRVAGEGVEKLAAALPPTQCNQSLRSALTFAQKALYARGYEIYSSRNSDSSSGNKDAAITALQVAASLVRT